MNLPIATIRSLAGSAEISDGRVTMAVQDEVEVRIRGREHTPLGEHERVASLAIAGEGIEADVELTGAAVDALADALDDVCEGDACDA